MSAGDLPSKFEKGNNQKFYSEWVQNRGGAWKEAFVRVGDDKRRRLFFPDENAQWAHVSGTTDLYRHKIWGLERRGPLHGTTDVKKSDQNVNEGPYVVSGVTITAPGYKQSYASTTRFFNGMLDGAFESNRCPSSFRIYTSEVCMFLMSSSTGTGLVAGHDLFYLRGSDHLGEADESQHPVSVRAGELARELGGVGSKEDWDAIYRGRMGLPRRTYLEKEDRQRDRQKFHRQTARDGGTVSLLGLLSILKYKKSGRHSGTLLVPIRVDRSNSKDNDTGPYTGHITTIFLFIWKGVRVAYYLDCNGRDAAEKGTHKAVYAALKEEFKKVGIKLFAASGDFLNETAYTGGCGMSFMHLLYMFTCFVSGLFRVSFSDKKELPADVIARFDKFEGGYKKAAGLDARDGKYEKVKTNSGNYVTGPKIKEEIEDRDKESASPCELVRESLFGDDLFGDGFNVNPSARYNNDTGSAEQTVLNLIEGFLVFISEVGRGAVPDKSSLAVFKSGAICAACNQRTLLALEAELKKRIMSAAEGQASRNERPSSSSSSPPVFLLANAVTGKRSVNLVEPTTEPERDQISSRVEQYGKELSTHPLGILGKFDVWGLAGTEELLSVPEKEVLLRLHRVEDVQKTEDSDQSQIHRAAGGMFGGRDVRLKAKKADYEDFLWWPTGQPTASVKKPKT